MSDYKYDIPEAAYEEAQRRIKKAKGSFLRRAATKLHLNNLGLTVIPPEIAQLYDLRELWLHDNKLTVILPEIAQLPNLTYLWLNNNQLSAIPPNRSFIKLEISLARR